jgi:hypothetical protein
MIAVTAILATRMAVHADACPAIFLPGLKIVPNHFDHAHSAAPFNQKYSRTECRVLIAER